MSWHQNVFLVKVENEIAKEEEDRERERKMGGEPATVSSIVDC